MTKVFLFLLIFAFDANAGDNGKATFSDPYVRTNYIEAFSSETLVPFLDVLQHDGSIINMPEDLKSLPFLAKTKKLDSQSYSSRHSNMIQAITDNLKKHKQRTILEPIYEGALTLSIQASCMGVLFFTMPQDSIGGGLGAFTFMNLVGYLAQDISKSVYAYYWPGNDPYARWEVLFAERMAYIPSQLWPQIIDIFGAARMRGINYTKATDFFDIAFNFPSIHHFPYVPPLTLEDSFSEKLQKISSFTETFFADYEKGDEARDQLNASVRAYLRKVAGNKDGFVCTHLQGPGGIGKTHYIRTLTKNISGILGKDFPMEEISIRSNEPSELEGNDTTPGQILVAISRIVKRGFAYGVLVFDEASWLNGGLAETAKKIFEPNLGRFKSDYLDGLEISLKGFWMIFLSNDPIEDCALKTRMIPVKFPSLKRASLEKMALDKLHEYIQGTGLSYDDTFRAPEISEAISASETMRDIGTLFPTAIEKILYGLKSKNEVH